LKYISRHAQRRGTGSRPTRGAWIEIIACCVLRWLRYVAPHAGRVD